MIEKTMVNKYHAHKKGQSLVRVRPLIGTGKKKYMSKTTSTKLWDPEAPESQDYSMS